MRFAALARLAKSVLLLAVLTVVAGWNDWENENKRGLEKLDIKALISSPEPDLPDDLSLFVKYKNVKGKKLAKKKSKDFKKMLSRNVLSIHAKDKTALETLLENDNIEYIELDNDVISIPLIHSKKNLDNEQSDRRLGNKGKELDDQGEELDDQGEELDDQGEELDDRGDDQGDDQGNESIDSGVNMVQAPQLWNITPKAKMTVCIIDSGYGLGHPDLPNLDNNVTGTDTGLGDWFVDPYGHGTFCSGIIGAIGDNNKGVVGVMKDPTRFKLHIGKALDKWGNGRESLVMQALKGCIDAGANVISMSIGGKYSITSQSAYKDAYNDGILLVAAAGNDGDASKTYPASYPHVMSVAAIDNNLNVPRFSQYNDQVEIAGPGVGIRSTVTIRNGQGFGYGRADGTSMATPFVAGVAALVWSHFPECSNNQIRNVLIRTARKIDSRTGCNSKSGFGVVQAKDAYDILKKDGCTAGDVSPSPLSEGAVGGCAQDPQYAQMPTIAPTAFSCKGKVFVLELTTDQWGDETAWELTNSRGKVVSSGSGYGDGKSYVERLCLPRDSYTFNIRDSENDGLCCQFGSGSYAVYYGGRLKKKGGDFGALETVEFGRTIQATASPTPEPTLRPTSLPTAPPTELPTEAPSFTPTVQPTVHPTPLPTFQPSGKPTSLPSKLPTSQPTSQPTRSPALSPSKLQDSLTPDFDACIDDKSWVYFDEKNKKKKCKHLKADPTVLCKIEGTNESGKRATGYVSCPRICDSCTSPSIPTMSQTLSPTITPTSLPSQRPSLRPTTPPSVMPTAPLTMSQTFSPTGRPTSFLLPTPTPTVPSPTSPSPITPTLPTSQASSLSSQPSVQNTTEVGQNASPTQLPTSKMAENSGCQDSSSWKTYFLFSAKKCGSLSKMPYLCRQEGTDKSGRKTTGEESCPVACNTCTPDGTDQNPSPSPTNLLSEPGTESENTVLGCDDDDKWLYEGKRDCSFIKQDPSKRCVFQGVNKSGDVADAYASCPRTCNTCPCHDDDEWEAWVMISKKTCDDMAGKPYLCGQKGKDGSGATTTAYESCRVSCETCDADSLVKALKGTKNDNDQGENSQW